MHLLVEVISLLLILVLLKRGWQAGFVITCLRFGQVSLAILLTLLAGRYLGNAIAEWAYRPRIITIPATGLLVGSITLYLAELRILRTQAKRAEKTHRWFSFGRHLDRLFGLVIGGLTAAILLPLLLWAGQLSATCLSTDARALSKRVGVCARAVCLIETGLYHLFSRSTDALHAHALAYSIAHPLHTSKRFKRFLPHPAYSVCSTTLILAKTCSAVTRRKLGLTRAYPPSLLTAKPYLNSRPLVFLKGVKPAACLPNERRYLAKIKRHKRR